MLEHACARLESGLVEITNSSEGTWQERRQAVLDSVNRAALAEFIAWFDGTLEGIPEPGDGQNEPLPPTDPLPPEG